MFRCGQLWSLPNSRTEADLGHVRHHWCFDIREQRTPERERLHRMNESQHHRAPTKATCTSNPASASATVARR